MAYATHADVQQACGGAAKLLQLADLDGDGVEDVGIVDGAVAEADALIDSYASKRYKPPFVAPSVAIVKLSARLATRILRRDRSQVLVSDVTDEETDRKWLTMLAEGLVTPGIDPQPQKSEIQVDQAGDRDGTKAVSRASLKGFW